MQPLAAQVTIPEWRHVHELAGTWWMEGWIFRGHQMVDWDLRTLFERSVWNRDGIVLPRSKYFEREEQLLDYFQRRAHQFVADRPQDVLEWLALIQHHGGPTRLLDFTHSFYVAVFFALERAQGAAAVWAINQRLLNDGATVQYRERTRIDLLDPFNWNSETGHHLFAEAVHNGFHEPIAISLEPVRLNVRLSAQQGVFVVPLSLERPFMENLAGSFGTTAEQLEPMEKLELPGDAWPQTPIVKIVLPVRMHQHALEDLQRMNVTAATLYPDLDGLARSLSFRLL